MTPQENKPQEEKFQTVDIQTGSSNNEFTNEKEDEKDELFEHYKIIVDKGQGLLRVDKFLMARMEASSRNRIQLAAKAHCILVNGEAVKSSYRVKPEDIIQLFLPTEKRVVDIIPQDIPIDVVYEDDDVMVVNKSAGMVVHPAYGNYTGTLLNALAFYFQGKKDANGEDIRPYLVHRIDKDTSGLLLVAKNEEAQMGLAEQFAVHSTDRMYTALVWGDFDQDSGTVEGNVGRCLNNRKIMDVFPEGNYGKRAITHWSVVERFRYVTLVQCRLETGRTHQIRVHMKYIRHPLFSDETYGGDKILKGTVFSKYKQFVDNCFKLLPRQALHATTIGFVHPRTHKKLLFTSSLPADMQSVIDKWRAYTNH